MTKKYVRVGFAQAQKDELWERWRSGEPMKSIGRELGKRSSSIFSYIRSTGGFTPVVRKRIIASLLEELKLEREEKQAALTPDGAKPLHPALA